jgi:hypothetical protein
MKVAFETHADTNSVETATTDGKLVRLETGKPFTTSDPDLIRVLDAHPQVKRHVPAKTDTEKGDS